MTELEAILKLNRSLINYTHFVEGDWDTFIFSYNPNFHPKCLSFNVAYLTNFYLNNLLTCPEYDKKILNWIVGWIRERHPFYIGYTLSLSGYIGISEDIII